MKKILITLLLASAGFTATSGQAAETAMEAPYADPTVTITNNSGQQIRVDWTTALSSCAVSCTGSQMVPAWAKKMQATGTVDWFVSTSKESPNPLVYTMTVSVYDVGCTLLKATTFTLSRSYQSITGDYAKNNIIFIVNSDYSVEYALR